MSKTISPTLINDYRNSIESYAQNLLEGAENPFKSLSEEINLDTIKKLYITKFSDDLKLKGIDTWGSKRIAKEQAEAILTDVMLHIN